MIKFLKTTSKFFLIIIILWPFACSRTVIEPILANGKTEVFGKPEFHNELYYFPKEALKNIKSYENNKLVLSDLGGLFNANESVKGARIVAHEVTVGDYIVSEPTENAPQGFFGRVKSIVTNGADYVVETVQATFEEVFKEVHFKYNKIEPINIEIPEIKLPYKAKLANGGQAATLTASLSGTINYVFDLNMEINSHDFELQDASLSLTTKTNNNLKLNTELSYEVEQKFEKIPIVEIPLTVTAFIGPFPVIIFQKYGIYAKVSLSGKIKLEAEMIKKSTFVIGQKYNKETGWQKIENPEVDNNSEEKLNVDLEGEVKMGPYVGATISFYGEKLASLSGEIGAYLKLNNGCNGKNVEIKKMRGSEINFGISFFLFSPNPNWQLKVELEFPISKVELTPFTTSIPCSEIQLPITDNTPPEIYEGGRSFGDPNIVTFDEFFYSFNGVGEFIATKSTSDNFEIQVRQEELKNKNGGGSVSWTTGLAINTGKDKLCFYPNKYFINQISQNYSINIDKQLPNGGAITGDEKAITIDTPSGDFIKIFIRKDALDYSIIPNSQRQGKLSGVFGNYDKNATNDLRIRNGAQIDGSYNSLYPNFTNSWRISQNQSLFVYDTGKTTETFTNRNFPYEPLVIRADQRRSAEQICKSAGVVTPFLEGCINDVVATGDASIADRAKTLQEENYAKAINFDVNANKGLFQLNESKLEGNYLKISNDSRILEGIKTNSKFFLTNGFETTIYFSFENLSQFIGLEFVINNNERFRKSISISPDNINFSNLNTNKNNKQFNSLSNKLVEKKIYKLKIILTPISNSNLYNYEEKVFLNDEIIFTENALLNNNFSHLRLPILGDIGIYSTSNIYVNSFKLYSWSFKSL
jgi:von Willebrand factor type D domain